MIQKFSKCVFCLPQTDLSKNTASALFQKYSSSIHFYFISQIDKLTEAPLSQQLVNYHEKVLFSEDCQYLRREYKAEEFVGKITQLSEYYKFNRELPTCTDRNIQKVTARYHENIRQYDFKKVKAAIKRQQGISITSQHNDSSSFHSQQQQLKSKYSIVLNGLNEDSKNQSTILNHICQSINQALKNTKPINHFKGFFQEDTKKFQEFMEKQNKKQKNGHEFKRQNINIFNQTKNKQNTFKNNINFIKAKPNNKNNKKSIQKMITNLTHSGQQRTRKERVDKKVQLYKPMTSNTVLGIKTFNNVKTIDQIYKSSFNYNDKFQSIKGKKNIQAFKKIKGQKPKPSSKSIRSPSMAKDKEEVQKVQTERMTRDQSKKMIKKSSSKRISEFKTRKLSVESLNNPTKNKKSISKDASKMALQSTEKNLSISKSKVRLSKQPSKQSLNSRQVSARSHSNHTQSINKRISLNQKPQELNHIDKLINKKLALFIKC